MLAVVFVEHMFPDSSRIRKKMESILGNVRWSLRSCFARERSFRKTESELRGEIKTPRLIKKWGPVIRSN
jgi:hypothetical protein